MVAQPDWSFEDDYGDDLLYLHGLANYASVSQTELFSEFDGYIDKISLSYIFDFKQRLYLKISVSQMASLSGFGGGSTRFFIDL